MAKRRKRLLRLLSWEFPPLVQGIAQYAAEHGWIDQAVSSSEVSEAEAIEQIRGASFDGIITQVGPEGPTLDFLQSSGVPVVNVSEDHPDLAIPRVLLDEVAIGRMVGEHFVERGYRHFAFCSAYDHSALAGRLEGFREVVGPVSEMFYVVKARPGSDGPLVDSDAFARELEHLPWPLAVMGFDDFTAVRVVRACESLGLLVPEQVSVVGCNDDTLCEFREVKMSSVRPDFFRQGYQAAALLDRLMSGASAPAEPIRIPPIKLAVRQSSDMFAIENIAVARAVRCIIQQYGRPDLRVDDVAVAAGVSRRHIEGLFSRHLGQPLGEYIRGMRIRQAKNSLASSSLAVSEIGARCGFSSPSRFSTAFRKATGLSPQQWRKRHREEGSPGSEA